MQSTGLPTTLTSGGVTVTYSAIDTNSDGIADTIQAKAGANNVFALSVNSTTGGYSFTLQGPLDHPSDSPANDSQTMSIDLSGGIVVKDMDGDSLAIDGGSFVISVEDDIPAQTTATVSVSVQEDALSGGNSSGEGTKTLAASGNLTGLATAGADGLKSWSVQSTGLPTTLTSGKR